MAEMRNYNEATTILFPLIDFGATDFESTPVTFAAGDTKISKDEGAFANTGSNPAHEGNGIYSLALTATEMAAARIVVTVIDQTGPKAWEDQAIVIETYGNASSQHPDAAVTVSAVNASALDSVVTAEPGAVPAWGDSIVDALSWLLAFFRNKQTQTSTVSTLRNDADSADIATATVSDDGVTFTKGEWA